MNVVLNDIDSEQLPKTCEEINAMGVKCVMQAADITVYENIEALLKLALDTFGHVDILVNNAGCAVSGAIWELPKRDIDWITELNFLSHVYGMKVFLPQMIKQGTPCEVVNVESTAGLMTAPTATMYLATKAAGVSTSESVYMAMKANKYPINVHCLVPAYVKTTIHLADLHRPERYAINDDPYYSSEEYKAGLIRSERGVMGGIPDWYVGECVFTAIEDEKFYIFTHPESQVVAQPRVQRLASGVNPQP
jgi:short-subunit dehydrogenase